ncbi:MAG: class I SAM-dependent methyltransferase [Actinomycetota bacterium]
MNREHREFLASEEWRELLRDLVFPFAFRDRSPADLGDDVVEIGPGPGLTTDLLRADLPRLTSVELDHDLASSLAARLAGTNVEVHQADATAMPFDDGRFSGAVCFTMLHHVPADRHDALFSEVLRVLRPGGLFVANDSVASDELAAFHVDDIYAPIAHGALGDRLAAMGYVDVEVWNNAFGWAAHARRP